MKAKSLGEFISRRVVTVEPQDNLLRVIEKMATYNIGAVVVLKTGRPVGILTERDILKRVVAKHVDPKNETVESYMTPKLVTVSTGDDVAGVAQRMVKGNFRHLPVVEDGELVGILSIKDVLAALLGLQGGGGKAGGADSED
ncbi:MAG: CBS domain-containing protein [Planctomycetes bacterium]|nr:CBS domain-containing protein [Planctomycetota bacterium]